MNGRLVVDEDTGIGGYLSGNAWGNVQEVLEEQLTPLGLTVHYVEFMGSAWFKVSKS